MFPKCLMVSKVAYLVFYLLFILTMKVVKGFQYLEN